jgi:hypothetical protein
MVLLVAFPIITCETSLWILTDLELFGPMPLLGLYIRLSYDLDSAFDFLVALPLLKLKSLLDLNSLPLLLYDDLDLL